MSTKTAQQTQSPEQTKKQQPQPPLLLLRVKRNKHEHDILPALPSTFRLELPTGKRKQPQNSKEAEEEEEALSQLLQDQNLSQPSQIDESWKKKNGGWMKKKRLRKSVVLRRITRSNYRNGELESLRQKRGRGQDEDEKNDNLEHEGRVVQLVECRYSSVQEEVNRKRRRLVGQSMQHQPNDNEHEGTRAKLRLLTSRTVQASEVFSETAKGATAPGPEHDKITSSSTSGCGSSKETTTSRINKSSGHIRPKRRIRGRPAPTPVLDPWTRSLDEAVSASFQLASSYETPPSQNYGTDTSVISPVWEWLQQSPPTLTTAAKSHSSNNTIFTVLKHSCRQKRDVTKGGTILHAAARANDVQGVHTLLNCLVKSTRSDVRQKNDIMTEEQGKELFSVQKKMEAQVTQEVQAVVQQVLSTKDEEGQSPLDLAAQYSKNVNVTSSHGFRSNVHAVFLRYLGQDDEEEVFYVAHEEDEEAEESDEQARMEQELSPKNTSSTGEPQEELPPNPSTDEPMSNSTTTTPTTKEAPSLTTVELKGGFGYFNTQGELVLEVAPNLFTASDEEEDSQAEDGDWDHDSNAESHEANDYPEEEAEDEDDDENDGYGGSRYGGPGGVDFVGYRRSGEMEEESESDASGDDWISQMRRRHRVEQQQEGHFTREDASSGEEDYDFGYEEEYGYRSTDGGKTSRESSYGDGNRVRFAYDPRWDEDDNGDS